jgi:hypothetical protein
VSLADGLTRKKCTLDHRGAERSRALSQIAIPALSPRGTEEQGMTGDANGDQEIPPNQEIYRTSQISDYPEFPPLSDRGSRGPGFKSRQPDQGRAGQRQSRDAKPTRIELLYQDIGVNSGDAGM